MISLPHKQQGVALLVALAFMAVITVIAVTAMRSTTSALRMAGNFEEKVSARQVAQSAIEQTTANPANFVVTGIEDTVNNNITLDSNITDFANASVVVTEMEYLTAPRGLGVSADKFDTALFSVQSTYDDVSAGGSEEELVQGYLILVPKQ